MSYTAYRELLTVRVYSPLHGRDWLISPMQYRVMCRVLSGRKFTIRSFAAETGYSRSGLADALQSLVSGGLIVCRTKLGRFGWTFAKAKPGVIATQVVARIQAVISNVRNPSTSLVVEEETPVTPSPDIQYDVFYEGSA